MLPSQIYELAGGNTPFTLQAVLVKRLCPWIAICCPCAVPMVVSKSFKFPPLISFREHVQTIDFLATMTKGVVHGVHKVEICLIW